MEERKTALLIIPETERAFNRAQFLNACIDVVLDEGFLPLLPAFYEKTSVSQRDFAYSVLDKVYTVYLFIDFGIDSFMLEIMEKAVDKMTVHFRRIPKKEVEALTLTPFQILLDVCAKSKYNLIDLTARRRLRDVVDHRYIYYRRARELTQASLAQIGMEVGVDHTTVLHGIREAYDTAQVVKLYEKYYGKDSEKC